MENSEASNGVEVVVAVAVHDSLWKQINTQISIGKGRPPMTPQEKALYHQIHPLKLLVV